MRKRAILLLSRETAADIQQASNAGSSIPPFSLARLIAEPVAEWLSLHPRHCRPSRESRRSSGDLAGNQSQRASEVPGLMQQV